MMKYGGHQLTAAEEVQQREFDRQCREKLEAACPVKEGAVLVRGYVGFGPCFWCRKQAPQVKGWKCPHCGKKQPMETEQVDGGAGDE